MMVLLWLLLAHCKDVIEVGEMTQVLALQPLIQACVQTWALVM